MEPLEKPALFLLDYDGTATTNSVELLWETVARTQDPSLATRPMVELMQHASALSLHTLLAIVRELVGPVSERSLAEISAAFQATAAHRVEFRAGLDAFLRQHGDRVRLLTEAVVPTQLPAGRILPVLRARPDLGKANPETYQTLCQELGLASGQVCLIDDCYFALRAAKRAGLHTVLVKDDPTGWTDTIGRGVDRVVADFYPLLERASAGAAASGPPS